MTSLVVNTDGSTSMVALPQPSASEAATAEHRWMEHSDLQPTGRYVRAGEQLAVAVPTGVDPASLSLAIGLYGPVASQNGGADVGVASFSLAGAPTFTAPHDGMVFVVSRASSPVPLTIIGGVPVPTWIRGTTTPADFANQLTRYGGAPYIELIADHVFGDFQSAVLRSAIEAADVEQVLARWDQIVELTNENYGLIADAAGVAHKSPNRIYIANPDSGVGWASATSEHITFQNDSGAGADLFAGDLYQWGLWHEVGHTYQMSEYLWDDLAEVTVNISSLHVQKALTGGNRLDTEKAGAAAYFGLPVAERVFDEISGDDEVWTKLLMFDQLRRGYGDSFYPRLNQLYRVQGALGIPAPDSSEAQKQRFIQNAAAVVQRDLTQFFVNWGITPSPESVAIMQKYNAPAAPIWQNFDSEAPVVDYVLDSYSVPSAQWTEPFPSLTIGQTLTPTSAPVTGLTSVSSDSPARVTSVATSTPAVGPTTGSVQIVLTNDKGVQNVLSRSAAVTPGTSIEFRGLGDASIAWLALDASTHTLRVVSSGTTAHSYFEAETYFSATLWDPYGRQVKGSSVAGNTSADSFREALTGTAYVEGSYLFVSHREPDRLSRFENDQLQAPSEQVGQWFLIRGDQLIPVTEPEYLALPSTPPSSPEITVLAATGIDGRSVLAAAVLVLLGSGFFAFRRRRAH